MQDSHGDSTLAPPHSLNRSFRDPAGAVFRSEGRILRIVGPTGIDNLNACLGSKVFQKNLSERRIVRTTVLDGPKADVVLREPSIRDLYNGLQGQILLEHEAIASPSYPYEWPPEMLHAAADLTLDIAEHLLNENLGLKDATPLNILFRGTQPVFIDLLSFERRVPGDATWLPYAQFIRTFLLPLAANKFFGFALDQLLLTRPDGLTPEEVYRWLGGTQKLRSPFLTLVSIPAWLSSRHDQDDQSIYKQKLINNREKAAYILTSLLRRLRRTLDRAAPQPGVRSRWSDYSTSNNNYSAPQAETKRRFVEQALAEFSPKTVLDVGCNTGHFSAMAARAGASVVAIDYDPVVVGEVWRNARAEHLDILPLVVNLSRPSPATGWRNQEFTSFLDRARGSFDLVFMLALIHHLLVTDRVPLDDILALASELTRDLLLIEFVDREDSMFQRLTRGREELHKDLSRDLFERTASRFFKVVRSQQLPQGNRWLYLLRKNL